MLTMSKDKKFLGEVKVRVKLAYGREIIEPVDDAGKLFAKLAKQTTLTRREIDLIKELGFKVSVVNPLEL